MLISEFARAAGRTPDTVRFYVRRGLLQPATTDKGGRNPYQIFSADDVKAARLIRLAQSLGMSLKEIAAISQEARAGQITRARSIEIMTMQLGLLMEKAAELETMIGYLQAKIAWLVGGGQGGEPDFPSRSALPLSVGDKPGKARRGA
jgi:MerR family transcriptional regulator, copper efflux regulator